MKGTIRGYDGVKYLVKASKGQVMSVLFSPANRSCVMNVFAPGTEAAVFIGSTSGNEYGANLTVSGDYGAWGTVMTCSAAISGSPSNLLRRRLRAAGSPGLSRQRRPVRNRARDDRRAGGAAPGAALVVEFQHA